MNEIKVSVFRRTKRSPYYQMQYRDPETDDKVTRSTKELKKRDAERVAAKWEAELREGRDTKRLGRMPWAEFRRLYEDEVLTGLAERTDAKVTGVFNVLERIVKPCRLADVNETTLGRYQAQLRQDGRAETTIKGHLAHILAALNWAKSKKLIYEVPDVKMPKRARKSKVMKGRPITTEEFERMLNSVVGVVTPKDAHIKAGRKPAIVASWRYVLRGLWLSGLRLNESMHVHWTDRSMLCVESLDARHPMLWIPSDLEKGNQDRVLPIAPEFAEFLRQTPPEGRQGYVFNPLPRRNRYSERLASHHVGRVLCAVGEAANVKVSETDGKVKFASAHDLRRSFGERWAPRVMPNVLQELMRHENIQTTMRYYVGENAKRTAAILWEAYNSSSDPQAMKSQTSPTESYLPSIL